MKELLLIKKQPNNNIQIEMASEDLCTFTAILSNTKTYQNGKFKLQINLPTSYPLHPPKIKFITKLCHPNVDFETGEICLDLLKEKWAPSWTILSACEAIRILMDEPEPLSPLNCDAAKLLRIGDFRGYKSLCKMYTIEHAL